MSLKNDDVKLPQEFIGLQNRIDNFNKVVKSNDLLYNFDTNQIVENEQLRKMIDEGRVGETILNPNRNPVPIFGTREEIDRVKTYWFPLMRRYNAYLENLKRTSQSKTNLFSLPIDIFILMIKTGTIKGKDILSACSVDSYARDYCNKYESKIYRTLVELYYPDRIGEIREGSEKKSYLKIQNDYADGDPNRLKPRWDKLSNKPISREFFESHLAAANLLF